MTEADNHPSQRVTCPQRTFKGVHSANRSLKAFAAGAIALLSISTFLSSTALASEPGRQLASTATAPVYATDQLAPTELPEILSTADATRYERIFALQDQGRFGEADKLIAALRDKSLMGHVEAQRYLSSSYKATYGELTAWLDQHGDLADAKRIYAVAVKKKPAKSAPLKVPSGSPAVLPYSIFGGVIEPPAKPWNEALAAFRKGQYAAAAKTFEAVARTPKASPWVISAGAYWAARANMMARQPQKVTYWLEEASRHSRTFYGLIAREMLGLEPDLDLRTPALDARDLAALVELPAGKRAAALLQIGDSERAEQELATLGSTSQAVSRAALALAGRANMPNLALRLGTAFTSNGDGAFRDAAIYPVPGWRPPEGYDIDRALIFAVMRQESAFNTRAKSPAGATGLMQLMPATASYMAEGERFRGNNRERLYEPEMNISLGQRYIRHLLADASVGNNLIMLAVAYNGGPGNLAKWVKQTNGSDDPLLFIESIPSRESRIFVERVMANLWIYRMRLGQPNESLTAVAGGEWPMYAALDGLSTDDVRVAEVPSSADALNRAELTPALLDQVGPPAGSLGALGLGE
ncbi:MAG TPA: lytic transglycosylase domain-containing protein [Alphaproteobacteria bacterium]|nr:lytic transglycosylase domain-containing protein [Alphaproteobacteria bacterium]